MGDGHHTPDDARFREAGLRLAAARVRACEVMPYLATALLALRPVPDPAVPTIGVDARWRLHWNPAWCHDLGIEELAGAWLHEVGHVLRDHGARFSRQGHPPSRARLFNIAGDAAINADLAAARVPLPHHPVLPHHIPGGQPGMTTEQFYQLLLGRDIDGGDGDDGGASRQIGPTADCGSAADGQPRPWERARVADGEGGGPGAAGDGEGGDGFAPGIDELTARVIRRRVADEVAASGQGRGSAPAGLRRWADGVREPAVDWRRELARVARHRLAPTAGRSDYSYQRLSRRSASAPGIVLPAMCGRRPPVITVVVDTSASMSQERLRTCLAELHGILRCVSRATGGLLRLVTCDARPTPALAIRSIRQVELVGGGGTDLRPAIRAAAGAAPRPELIVVLTDGDTPWDVEPPAPTRRVAYVAVLVAGERPVPGWVRPIIVS